MAIGGKRRWGRIVALVAAVIIAIGLGLWMAAKPIGEWLFVRTVERNLGRDASSSLPDGLHLVLCGTGSPLPDPSRNSPCTIVIAGKTMLLFDAGSGTARRFGVMGLPIGRIDAAFLTHFHSDHIDGLGETMVLRWASVGRDTPLPVYGPQGVETVVDGLRAAYAPDTGYRVAHHGADTVPPAGAGGTALPFTIPEGAETLKIFDRDGVTVSAIRVDHGPVKPAVGYRIDYKGRSVVISGDTARDAALARACNGCDILLHEALNPRMVGQMQAAAEKRGDRVLTKILSDIPGYHASPEDAAKVAAEGKAGMLVLTHLVPPLPTPFLYTYFLGDAAASYTGEIVVGEDGMVFSLPAGGSAFERSTLPR